MLRALESGEVPSAAVVARRFGVSERALVSTLARERTDLPRLLAEARLDLHVSALEARMATLPEVTTELREV